MLSSTACSTARHFITLSMHIFVHSIPVAAASAMAAKLTPNRPAPCGPATVLLSRKSPASMSACSCLRGVKVYDTPCCSSSCRQHQTVSFGTACCLGWRVLGSSKVLACCLYMRRTSHVCHGACLQDVWQHASISQAQQGWDCHAAEVLLRMFCKPASRAILVFCLLAAVTMPCFRHILQGDHI